MLMIGLEQSMKKAIFLLFSLMILTTTFARTSVVEALEREYVADSTIVGTDHQKYSYDEMMEDLDLLSLFFPECVAYETRGTTNQGRTIPIVYFGNVAAEKKVMVTAAIHAREYLTAQLVMAMIEHYARNYEMGSFAGCKYADLFGSVCFVILPMVNPDGVEIAQRGVDGAVTPEARQWVLEQLRRGMRSNQIKSNSRGVDLNRNFANGFGRDPHRVGFKAFDHYPGAYAYSEPETRLMKEIADSIDFACFLNYHTHGNLMYYGCKDQSLWEVNNKALKIARIIQGLSGYVPRAEAYPAYGSWADEVETIYRRPSVTIEIGTRNPVPISEFRMAFNRNVNVWASLAKELR